MIALGIGVMLIMGVYIWKSSNGVDEDSADYWSWLAREPLRNIVMLRTLLVVGLLTIAMGFMLATYRH